MNYATTRTAVIERTTSARGRLAGLGACELGDATSHVAAVKVPAVHELVPDTVYPLLHVGWHVDPDANELVHVPTPPLAGAVDASHAFAEHVAAVKVPALHELVPDTVYPLLHVGWHVDPDANELVHDPTPPLVGAVDASHGFAEHVTAVKVPALHELGPDTVYPLSHVG